MSERNLKAPVSIIILALNEEEFIGRSIGRVIDWADEVLVVDSGSADRTREIAKEHGARVIQQPWLGWVGQRHAGMDAARNDWCMFVEADEIVDAELGQAVVSALAVDPDPTTGFVVTRVEEYCSRLLPLMRRHSKRDIFVRLMHRKFSGYDPAMLIHEEVRISGQYVRLPGRLLHWRNFTLNQRFDQDNRNASLEAEMLRLNGVRPTVLNIGLKPVLRFCWYYFRCGFWKLGKLGLVASMSYASAEFMRQAKLWEALEVKHLRHPPVELYSARTAYQVDMAAQCAKGTPSRSAS